MDVQLDDLDRRLLALLQANARAPTAELARKLKVARTTVVARIARLERSGIVAGYGVRLGQLEDSGLRAFCGLAVSARNAASVMRSLEWIAEVEEVWAVSGQFDYMVLLRCATADALDRLLDQLGQIDGVKQTQTSVVLSRKIDRRRGLADAAERPSS